MKISIHLMASLILVAALYPFFGWSVLFILMGGVLIDADHYFWYVYTYKNFNIVKSYKFFIKNLKINDFTNVEGAVLIFHTIEFLLVMVLFSFYNKFLLLFTIGLLSHYLLDFIWFYFILKRFILNHSIIWWIVNNKHKV
ncbi:hypothetical protein HYX04_05800 [Candidatus Woesearchaeota archaeon]|nr:hypothetical protein [Candidatus Woesearchaeota archaeon]